MRNIQFGKQKEASFNLVGVKMCGMYVTCFMLAMERVYCACLHFIVQANGGIPQTLMVTVLYSDVFDFEVDPA